MAQFHHQVGVENPCCSLVQVMGRQGPGGPRPRYGEHCDQSPRTGVEMQGCGFWLLALLFVKVY